MSKRRILIPITVSLLISVILALLGAVLAEQSSAAGSTSTQKIAFVPGPTPSEPCPGCITGYQ